MKKIKQIAWVLIYLPFIGIQAQNGPVTLAGNIVTPDSSITLPVIASDFNNIGSCGLQLLYDPEIMIATAVTAGPLLGGNLNSNLTVAGRIILGWYTWPGVSLADSTVIFNIVFSRAITGTSAITWFDDGYSCYYSNGQSVILNDLPSNNYYINGSVTFQLPAPFTMAPSISAFPGTTVDIPIRISGFRDIGKINLVLQYDPLVLSLQTWSDSSGFPGLTVRETNPGTIQVEGTVGPDGSGISLPDSSVLFTLHCNYSGGSTGLNWKLDGGSCEFAGPPPSYPVLFDTSNGSYYFNGAITPSLGVDETDANEQDLRFYPNPFSDHGTINWSMPSSGKVSCEIYNMSGKLVESRFKNCDKPGEQKLAFSNSQLSPGIYTVRIRAVTTGQFLINPVRIICQY